MNITLPGTSAATGDYAPIQMLRSPALRRFVTFDVPVLLMPYNTYWPGVTSPTGGPFFTGVNWLCNITPLAWYDTDTGAAPSYLLVRDHPVLDLPKKYVPKAIRDKRDAESKAKADEALDNAVKRLMLSAEPRRGLVPLEESDDESEEDAPVVVPSPNPAKKRKASLAPVV